MKLIKWELHPETKLSLFVLTQNYQYFLESNGASWSKFEKLKNGIKISVS